MAKRLLLVRHGESIWNAEGRWQGSANPPLSETGRSQARQLADAVREVGIDRIVTSDLDRAIETGSIVAEELGLDQPSIEARLRERDVGDISGHTRQEIETKWPGLLEQWRTGELTQMPGGEDDITPRVTAGLQAVADSAADGSVVLVVTHGGVIGAIDRWLGTEYRRVGNVQGRWLVVDDGSIRFDAHFGDDLDSTTPVAL